MHQHFGRRWLLSLVAAAVLTTPALPAMAQTPADNTKVNKQDRAKGAMTADQQKESAGDRELTQKIRKAIMDDKSLSSYAHNVKVISRDGKVTIKGPVRSEDEKRVVVAKATELAGADNIVNQVTIAPAKPSKK